MSANAYTPAFGGGWLTVSNFYDGAGSRLLRVTRTGQPGTLYAYDELGSLAATALDVDGDGVFTAADLATTAAVTHEQDISGDWWRVTARTHSRGGVTNGLGVTREQVTGLSPVLLSRTVAVGADSVTTTVTRAFEPDTEVIATVSQADPAAPSVRRTLYGHELESAGLGSATLSGYDGFARVVAQTVTNETGTVSTSMIVYDTLGNAVTNATTYGSQTAVSATGYDSRGRAVSRTDALGNTVFTAYDSLGTAVSRSGAIYPVQYAYDSVGRMTSLATIRNGGAWDVTQWRFDPHTGLATNKVYADDSRIGYTYTSVGKPLRTTWARGEWREHAYNADGLLATTAYSDATPAVSLAYDAFQRLAAASNAVAAYAYANSAIGTATNETVKVGGNIFTLTRKPDDHHRLSALTAEGATVYHGYDSENRLAAVSNDVFAVNYAYTSDGWDAGYTITLTNGMVLSRNLTRDPHRRSLITAITNAIDGVPLNPLVYGYDLLNRVTARNADTFGYNAHSEVTSALIQPAHTNRYEYDGIGNALWASLNTATNVYLTNPLNQYTNIANGSTVEPLYDPDGNMTWDGRFTYAWDAEHRLIAAYSNNLCIVSNAYDHMSRRVTKVTPCATHSFLYDGWNLVLETISSASGTTTNHYIWGKDLSGSLQGAGGVGGLLAVSRNGTWYFPFFDNNGNITAYADESGAIVAECVYDIFGGTISQFGPMADHFRFRFSTKYLDHETGLYYYAHRFYSPELMRWLNRDPIAEKGGINLYAACANDAVNQFDYLGLFDIYVHTEGLGGHVGIGDDQGANYDYGRYRGSYSGLGGLAAGPNILVKSTGWPPQGKPHAFTVFHFNVCPALDKKIRDALAEKLAKGRTIWPDAVLKKYKTPPSALSDIARFMGTDWSTMDNCMTFTFSTLVSAVVKVANDPKATQREKGEAKALLGLAWGAVWTPTTGAVKSLLKKADSQYDWVEQKGDGGQNAKPSDDKSCCGSGS